MLGKAVRVGFCCGVLAAVALPACGGNSSNSMGVSTAGAGGSAGSGHGGAAGRAVAAAAGETNSVQPVTCGKKTCAGVSVPLLQNVEIPACCADPTTETCGLDSSVLAMFGQTSTAACEPLHQTGSLDSSCAGSSVQAASGIPIQLPGCCRASGECGYRLDNIDNLIQLGLGCVDSTPFLNGGTPATCGENSGGEGGMGGAGPSEASESEGGSPAGAGGA